MSATSVLELCDVRKHFSSGGECVRAVDGVSLSVAPGELVALYGPSGSGKSTLLRIVAGVERADAGSVLVDGRDITRLSPKESARYRLHQLGWVQQDADLEEGATVVENAAIKHLVASRRIRDGHRAVTPLLKELGLGHRLDHRADTLSGGERQRVMIAQALSLAPKVLLADEPTGNLHSQLGQEVLELLQAATHERAMATLLVTHDERAAAYADKVYTLQDGVLHDRVTEAGAARWD
ncbi:ABC transporter ATP-binding protein YtrE [Baekduia alba]|uniref:ABC transporter ATP-binding protein n=1 Tax=Baekduia alba TaxID=2997333 RepID=UPI002341DD38|nr:ABC transporter ATP-binding protein [Baekduia alba]WCB96407.1 ABC transporter ATP-binding protein YtrE [Baekduia alba]